MVQLKATNYDIGNQQKTKAELYLALGATTLYVESTTGFPDSGFLVIDAFTESAEILTYTSKTLNSFVITACVFEHSAEAEVSGLLYDQVKYYESETDTGTYTYIASSIKTMTYDQATTDYNHTTGDTAYFYKRTFYNSTDDLESDIAVSDYWQVNEDDQYLSVKDLRTFLQFGENDFPTDADLHSFIILSQKTLYFDLNSSDPKRLYLAQLLLSKYYVLRGLASRAISKGYLTINAEGRSVTKAYNEFNNEAKDAKEDYQEFIRNNSRIEATKTNFITDLNDGGETRQKILDNQHGYQNAVDYAQFHSFGLRGRR